MASRKSSELAHTGTRVFGLSQLLGHALGIGTVQATNMARLAYIVAASAAALAAAEPKVTNKAEIKRLNSRDLPAVPTVGCARGATRINSSGKRGHLNTRCARGIYGHQFQ